MDVTTKGIVLKATDYKENDKLILLYSLEYGKITVHAKGIRKSSAKLKFAADQFCFGQYELSQIGDRFLLKTCDQLESFYTLREDVVVYYAACTVAECLVNCSEEEAEPEVFVETLRALNALCDGADPYMTALRFLLAFLEMEGLKLQSDRCAVCGESSKKMFLDAQRGGVVCESCRAAESIPFSPREIATCKMVESMPYDKLKNLNFALDAVKTALQICNRYFAACFSPLKSLNELLKL